MSTHTDELLKRQDATARVRKTVTAMLLEFIPARELKVSEMLWIADMAAASAFDEFDPEKMAKP